MKGLFLLVISAACALNSLAQAATARISGRVFYIPANRTQTVYRQYPADVKVLLVRVSTATINSPAVLRDKKLLCSNDKETIRKYSSKVYYTDKAGYFQFANLVTSGKYLLVICDKKMQVFEVSTGSKATTYTVKDKQVYL